MPDVPRAADDRRAWASLSEDGQDEWLELNYTPVEAGAILIYETYNPGAVSEVVVTDDKGTRHRVFQGQDPSLGSEKAVLVVSLAKPIKIASVRVEIASMRTPGWNEIDAVGLMHAKGGDVSWAESARASSTYAEPNVRQPRNNGNNFIPRARANGLRNQLLNQRGFMPASGLTPAGGNNPFDAGAGMPGGMAGAGEMAPMVANRYGTFPLIAGAGANATGNQNVDNLRAENEQLKRLLAEQRDRQAQQDRMLQELQKAVQDMKRGNAGHDPAPEGTRNKPPAR
jgi:hypothetical protein